MNFVDELQRHLEEGIAVESHRRLRQRRIAQIAGVAGLVTVMVLGGALILSRPSPSQVATGPTDPTSVGALDTGTTSGGDADRSTQSGPEVPASGQDIDQASESFGLVGSVVAWTDAGLIVWGGTDDFGSGTVTTDNGILYDIDSGTWRDLPPAPGGPQSEAVAAWTGSEVLVCCGNDGNSHQAAALAYDPTTDTWRELRPPPPEIASGSASAWIDEKLMVIAQRGTAAYDPATDTWETLAPPPIELGVSPSASVVAAGDQLVVWPRPSSRSSRTGLVYDLAGDSWSELPEPPPEAWPAMADVAWTGTELIIVGGLPAPFADDSERLVGARFDWATRTWTALPDVWPEPISSEGNLGSQSILWTGDVLLVVAGSLGSGVDPLDGVVATYNPAASEWRRLTSLMDGATTWHPPLLQAGDEVVATAGGRLQRIAVAAEAGEPVGPAGLPEAHTPAPTDLPLSGVPLTLVGTNGNGADILVLDLDLGVQAVYEDGQHHQLGPGGLTDLAMGGDRSLYVWRTDDPTVRFQGGTRPYGGDRLSFGELTQPGEIVEAGGSERVVLPVPSSSSVWIWEVDADGGVARLVDPGAGSSFEARLGGYGPQGVTASGGLVLSTDTTIAYVTPEGRRVDSGPGSVVAIAGDEILLQECSADTCSRRWVDPETGTTTRAGGSDSRAWAAPSGPIIPGHSAPLATTSPDGSQILVTATPPGGADDDPTAVELLRVDVASMTQESVPLPQGVPPALATWGRDGRSIVVLWGEDVAVVHLPTGRVEHHPDLIPEGYYILAAG